MHLPHGDDQQIVSGSVSVDNNMKAKFDAIEYWQKRLASVTPTIFPLRSSPSPVVTSSAFQSFAISHENLTRDYGIELRTLITLAYALTLGAHSASPDEVIFGYNYCEQSIDTPYVEDRIHSRSIALPYNIAFNWDQITLDFLRGLQTDIAEIDDHPRVALREIPISSAAPLFRTILSCFPLSTSEDKLHAQGSVTDDVNYDFAFLVRAISSEDIQIETRFAPASISEPEIKVFQDHFGTALYSILQNLTSSLRDIDLVSPEEKQRLIVTSNPAYPLEPLLNPANNVTELIERQASRTPQRIALQFGQEMFVTYREMDMFANSLAHTLIANGVKRGDLVGIYMDKSCEMFVSILAIHKSGGGYIPLDPTHPAERIQTILSLAAVRVVLTSDELRKQFDSLILAGSPFSLAVNIHKLTLASKPNVLVDRDDICHVLFTSGSTGTPKGVVLTHGSIIESLIGVRAVVGPRDDRVLQFSNYTFDVSVWDWSVTLSDGGTLCIVPRRELMDNLGAVADGMDITFLETTPTVLSLVKPEEVPSLQKLVMTGELLTSGVRNTWADVVTLVNSYGPTETSTGVLARTNVTSSIEGSNIGWPFGLNAVYILDERMRPVPLGCVGELFISGPQVARGYLNNPEQTAKAFMDDPFRPGSTMYATGDFVRMSPVDGSFSYLGRRDTQIKIRGLRVEIGEIETVLKAASNLIANAVVLKIHIGHDILVAFLEHPSDLHSASAEPIIIRNEAVRSILAMVRTAVRKKLPSYMAPGNYVVLDKFPLASSGKLDRKALGNFFYKHEQGIREHRADSELLAELSPSKPGAAPETERQAMLRSLWALILNLNEDSFSIDDNFYAVGGDSISAIRLASLAREASLPLLATDIIENPTIRTMAPITESSVVNHDFDDDDVPSVSLDQMAPNDLTLMDLDQQGLDALRGELLPKHGLLSSDVLDIFPCTALQTSFLMAGLLVDNAYIVRLVYDLPFGTTSAGIQQAFGDFINHSNGAFLRTTFVFDHLSNRFLQAMMRPMWKQMEWSTVIVTDEVELDIAVAEYQEGRGALKFDPAELHTRACIFELNGIPRVLAWSLHHALADHWTLNNAEFDIGDIYAGRSLQSRRSFKPMLKYLERLDRTAGLDFWRRHLLNASPTTFLQALPGAPRAAVDKNISRKVHADYSSLTQQFGIAASSLITAAWAIVLAAHAGNTDVVFGQVVAGRNAPIKDIDSLMGNTINTVPRRVVLKPEASVLDTLRKIQLEQYVVSRHEHTALADLIAEEIPVSSLFRTLLNFVNLPGDQKEGASGQEVSCEHILWNRKAGTLDGEDLPFSLTVTPWGTEGFVLGVNYTRAVISQEEVSAILDHVEAAIRFIVRHPNAPISDVELVNEKELRRMIPVVNVRDELSTTQSISELIEAQVRKTPQRIALQWDQEAFMTYAEMDGLANDLAQKLVNGGVKRGTLIALYMDKSIEMFLAILAVHKAGGGYVPLDIDHPAERIQTIIRLAQTTTVLTTKELLSGLASTILDGTVKAVSIDFRDLSPGAKPDVGRVSREDICHVLFTSGSTGTPKGVILTHGSIIESAIGSQDVIGPLNGRVLQFSNYTFDVSVWDWSATLIAGGTLCIARKQRLIDDLGGVSRDMDVTFIETTPTVLSLIHPEDVPSLQMMAIGGEVLTPNVRDTWADAVSFINVYGPTEASTNVLALRDVTSSTECSNIGYGFGLNAVYNLDERLRPVPLGCVGELFIGGPQVARGYLQNPEETAKAFVADPFRPGSIMYATGDLVRMNPVDGSLSFLDRRDTQIKIRGLRVETGEIEAVLKTTRTAMTNAVVIKVDVGHETLVAFLEYGSDVNTEDVTIVDDEAVGEIVASLRHAIRQKLPSYMAPTIYVALNRFPVASTGKLDRKALKTYFYLHQQRIQASIANATGGSAGVDAALLTEMQLAVRSLWASILRISDALLHIDDDFYTTGGDSVSAIRLASAAREAGFHLPATDIIRNPTIRAMAKIAESAVVDHEFDDDEAPSVTLDAMGPEYLTGLTVDQTHLDFLRVKLLPDHGLSARQVNRFRIQKCLPFGTDGFFPVTSWIYTPRQDFSQVCSWPDSWFRTHTMFARRGTSLRGRTVTDCKKRLRSLSTIQTA
ncbi:amino acid adenylation [Ramaria rubella]|nr:amino acid adenylation [Ramaria rubella]